MGLTEVISKRTNSLTKADWVKLFRDLKIENEELLVVYADLNNLDDIIGGAQTVIEAIYEVVGNYTTIVMPAHDINQMCPMLIDKSLSDQYKAEFYENMPAFDKYLSPILAGSISETFARIPLVARSGHPLASYLAVGIKANWFMNTHSLQSMFGEESPLQKLYAQNAKVLCLGTDYHQLTALHLAEYYTNSSHQTKYEAVIMENGERKRVEFEDLVLDSSQFNEIGAAYEQATQVSKYSIGDEVCYLLDYHSLIDFATNYLKTN